ncbi:MAG: transposase, partial [Ruminobacter sp.]|uniref:transposase n=1 Tax=Ruminobacter sp. TaxID=2774296 RepID=UPI00257A1AE4
EGIIAHATYKISSGKIEGINQKIKTIRRHGYGYPDDEYFFLKVIDASWKKYIRNQRSHKIND